MTNHDQVRASRHQNGFQNIQTHTRKPSVAGCRRPTRVMGALDVEYGPAVGRSLTRSVARTRSTARGPRGRAVARGAVDASDARRPRARVHRSRLVARDRARGPRRDAFFPRADDDDDE